MLYNLLWALIGACLTALGFWWILSMPKPNGEALTDFGHPGADAVDPWYLQQRLMIISSQRLPAAPMITNDALLYYALILEEVREAGDTLIGILAGLPPGGPASGAMEMLRQALQPATRSMGFTSRRIRSLLELRPMVEWQGITLNLSQARDLLDDTTDIQVVNSGFALALGLPGAEGYQAVGISNLSKANPKTGLIDKDPSGKWIKGEQYVKPALETLLLRYFPSLKDEEPTRPDVHLG